MFRFVASLGIWIWIVAIVTFTPLVIAIIFLTLEVYTVNVRGVIIQSLASVPILFSFRQKLVVMLHDIADWISFGKDDEDKEKTKAYRLFRLIGRVKRPQSGRVAVIERSLISIFDCMGIIFILFYLIAGMYLQNTSS